MRSDYTPKDLEEIFWLLVDKPPNDCWEWLGDTYGSGYGRWRSEGAHRTAYKMSAGPIPDGMLVLHSCDNRLCVRPDHLSLGTHSDNMTQALKRGRAKMPYNYNQTLCGSDVLLVRALYETGNWTMEQIGDLCGVTHSAISLIVRYKTWKNLP